MNYLTKDTLKQIKWQRELNRRQDKKILAAVDDIKALKSRKYADINIKRRAERTIENLQREVNLLNLEKRKIIRRIDKLQLDLDFLNEQRRPKSGFKSLRFGEDSVSFQVEQSAL